MPGLLDTALIRLAPDRALARELARRQYQLLTADQTLPPTSETRWRGASRWLRSLRSWVVGIGSPSRDLPTPERTDLIARSRDAHRNQPLARAAISRARTNIIGTGLMRRAQVDAETLGLEPAAAETLNAAIDREWESYAEDPAEVDAEATCDHYQLQGLALVSALLSGDCFVLTPYQERPGCRYGTRLQLIEADRVCNPGGGPNTATLTDGIEFDALGAPVAYHLARHHPGDPFIPVRAWDRVAVFGAETGRRRVLHLWHDKERPGQPRGAPWLAPILEPLYQLERYSRAELMAAVVSGLLTVFIENDGTTATESTRAPEMALGDGAIWDLEPGQKANLVNPARPNAGYDPFTTAIVRQIGAALEIPADELLLAYQSSYSAARAAMLQAWRFYTTRRWWQVVQFCQPSSELWFDEAVARGRLPVTGYADPARRRAYTRALWIGPARGAIDELKEANAAGRRIDIGISNETLECAAMSGESWSTVYAQRVREVDARRRDGLTPPPPGTPAGAAPPEEPGVD